MGSLDEAIDISEVVQRNLWVIYGKSNSGKTTLASTFPKPMLVLQIGDDGISSIKDVDDVMVIKVKNILHLKTLLKDARKDKKYKTVLADTFSLLVNEWVDENAVKKSRRVSQQMWGDLKTDTEEIVKLAYELAAKKHVILTCHEVADSFEGMEDEIAPDVRPSVSKGARTYLEAMANYGLHSVVIQKQVEKEDGTTAMVEKYAVHLASNPYYWVKAQKPASIKLPKLMINPSYKKIMRKLKGENRNG